ncbi:MAG: RNA polymerase sigma-54 factor [Chitinophagaceae bacterium]|nr:MAG: RNA polymerase sigma-54 factor [Chitinophagaceae bacterium]
MLNQKLQQKLQQKLSPQQIQLMKLLQIPTIHLEQRIKEELETNPALDEGNEYDDEEDSTFDELSRDKEENNTDEKEEFDFSDYIDDDIPDYKTRDYNYTNDEEDKTMPVTVSQSFHEHLESQVGMLNLNEQEEKIARQLIGSIDDDGYLRREIDAISDDLAFSQNVMVEENEIRLVLDKIQQMDPPGVGATNLQECLQIQLEKIDREDSEFEVALRIIEDHFDSFTKKHYEKIQKSMSISESELRNALEIILKLNPKPGSAFNSAGKSQQYITPDFIITNQAGELILQLNQRNSPELRINKSYREMLENFSVKKKSNKSEKDTVQFIKQKIDSAKWFIDAINQRKNTLEITMRAIMQFQYEFFISGDETKLKPMILKNIADITKMDISTVSRVANSKYVQTEFGIFQLKYFFSESLQTDDGEEVSTREVKKILSDLIEAENKKKPLSDQNLMELLKEKGYNIARRTVAKYREQLHIPVARLRKSL